MCTLGDSRRKKEPSNGDSRSPAQRLALPAWYPWGARRALAAAAFMRVVISILTMCQEWRLVTEIPDMRGDPGVDPDHPPSHLGGSVEDVLDKAPLDQCPGFVNTLCQGRQ
jgi:hypothetical protein